MQFSFGKEINLPTFQIQKGGSINFVTVFLFGIAGSSVSFGVSEHSGSEFSSSYFESSLELLDSLCSTHFVGICSRKWGAYVVLPFFSRLGKLVICFYYGSP